MRNLSGWQRWIVGGWLVCAVLVHLYTAGFGIFDPRIQRAMHLLFLLPMAFLLYPATKKSPRDRITITDAILAVLAVIPALYLIVESERISLRFEYIGPVSNMDIAFGLLNIFLILEGVRRAVVPAMAVLIGVFFAYLFVTPYLPGILYSEPFALSRIVEMQYLLSNDGIYGMITGVSATFVALFVIFGAFIQASGVGGFFTNLACRVAGGARGGPAKIAVVSSGMFGSISGVSTANVYATGTFTIPLMKRLGYKKQFAGSVEAAASTGGLIMPPIMGAGAFVMAQMTEIPYLTIIVAAAIGAVLYYIGVGMMVHFEAVRLGLRGMDKKELPPLKQVLREVYLLIPIVGLVYLLVIGYSPFMAAFLAILLAFVVSFFRRKTMMTPRRLLGALELGGRNMIMIAMACAGAGMVVSIISQTGLGLVFSGAIAAWSGGILLVAYIFVMLISIVLGMGVPVTPAYILAISVGGPALIAMGCELLSAHLFVFYFAILATVTPPICITAYAAASISGSDPLKTGFGAFKLAIAGYLVPFAFIYNPALLMRGSVLEILTAVLLMVASIILLAIGLTGCFTKKINIPTRILLVGMGIALVVFVMFFPVGLNLAIVGIIASPLIIIQVVRQVRRRVTERIPLEEASGSGRGIREGKAGEDQT